MGQKVTKMAYFGSFLTTFWTTLFIFIYVCLILGVNCVHIWVKHEKRAKKGSKSGSKMGHFGCHGVRGTPKKLTFCRQNIKFDMLGGQKMTHFWVIFGSKSGVIFGPPFFHFWPFRRTGTQGFAIPEFGGSKSGQEVVQKWVQKWVQNGSF